MQIGLQDASSWQQLLRLGSSHCAQMQASAQACTLEAANQQVPATGTAMGPLRSQQQIAAVIAQLLSHSAHVNVRMCCTHAAFFLNDIPERVGNYFAGFALPVRSPTALGIGLHSTSSDEIHCSEFYSRGHSRMRDGVAICNV